MSAIASQRFTRNNALREALSHITLGGPSREEVGIVNTGTKPPPLRLGLERPLNQGNMPNISEIESEYGMHPRKGKVDS